ncbi:MAG: DsrE family protein [Acetobacterium sp.]
MSKLNILWTTSELPTIENMLTMYTSNAITNGWWDEIHIVIWGASSKLIGEDVKIQKLVTKMIDKGVTFEACKACSDKYKSSDVMTELGIEVKYMGSPLTNYIKSDDHFITI